MPAKMTDEQKCKHDYSVHQDALLWSRIQILIAIQSGTLTGLFLLGKDGDVLYASLLLALGLALTALLWNIAERDQLHRERSLKVAEVAPTVIEPEIPLTVTGADSVRIVIVLLALADVLVFMLPLVADRATSVSTITLITLIVLVIVGIGCWVRSVAEKEKKRIWELDPKSTTNPTKVSPRAR